jgi:MSHA biogenesis protein MshG
MPTFSYRGRKESGEPVEGSVDAASASEVADRLLAEGIAPTEIREAIAVNPGINRLANREVKLGNFNPVRKRVKAVDILLFSRQLHTLLRSGVPILKALTGLQETSNNLAMQHVLLDLRESLNSGHELSYSLAKHPKLFNPFYLSMVRVGELTGRLEESFIRLFGHLEFELFMKDQVKSVLFYPGMIVTSIICAMIILNIWVIPTFAKVFKGFNAELPLMTRILIAVSDFFTAWWPVMLGFFIASAVGAYLTWHNPRGRYHLDRLKLKLPVAGKILEKATLARYARSFSLASRSGVPITHALSNVAETVDNAYISAKILEIRNGVERGESILRASMASGIFTPMVLQMIAVGDESGALEDMMQEVAEMYQGEVEYELKTLAQQVEPILLVLLGILVLVLALGVFLPVWDMGRAAIKR